MRARGPNPSQVLPAERNEARLGLFMHAPGFRHSPAWVARTPGQGPDYAFGSTRRAMEDISRREIDPVAMSKGQIQGGGGKVVAPQHSHETLVTPDGGSDVIRSVIDPVRERCGIDIERERLGSDGEEPDTMTTDEGGVSPRGESAGRGALQSGSNGIDGTLDIGSRKRFAGPREFPPNVL